MLFYKYLKVSYNNDVSSYTLVVVPLKASRCEYSVMPPSLSAHEDLFTGSGMIYSEYMLPF